MKNYSMRLLFVFTFLLSNTLFSQSNIRYVYPKKPTLTVHFLKGFAHTFLKHGNGEKKLEQNYVDAPAKIPSHYFKEFKIEVTSFEERQLVIFKPKDKESEKTVLFLHGGAYMYSIYRQHWNFVAELVRQTKATFIVPDYPLTPKQTYSDGFKMVRNLYDELLKNSKPENLILMGDSAGGGLAMAFCEENSEKKVVQPSQLILIAPWFDIALSNPEIATIEKKDPTLNKPDLVKIGKAWSGNLPSTDYHVSPINGNYKGLPKVSLFVGSHDILIVDCEKFKKRMDAEQIPFNYHIYPKYFHDWIMLVRLKASRNAIRQVADLIRVTN